MLLSSHGVWRSPVAHLHGVQVVVGSNPITPTNFKRPRNRGRFFVLSLPFPPPTSPPHSPLRSTGRMIGGRRIRLSLFFFGGGSFQPGFEQDDRSAWLRWPSAVFRHDDWGDRGRRPRAPASPGRASAIQVPQDAAAKASSLKKPPCPTARLAPGRPCPIRPRLHKTATDRLLCCGKKRRPIHSPQRRNVSWACARQNAA